MTDILALATAVLALTSALLSEADIPFLKKIVGKKLQRCNFFRPASPFDHIWHLSASNLCQFYWHKFQKAHLPLTLKSGFSAHKFSLGSGRCAGIISGQATWRCSAIRHSPRGCPETR